MGMISALMISFFALFLAQDVFGKIPGLNRMFQGVGLKEQNKILNNSCKYALGLSVALIFSGKILLGFLRVSEADFKIAGGAVLFLFTIVSLIRNYKTIEKQDQAFPEGLLFLFDLVMMVMLLMLTSVFGIITTLTAYIFNLIVVQYVYRQHDYLIKKIKFDGIKIVSEVDRIILAGFAMTLIREGILFFAQ